MIRLENVAFSYGEERALEAVDVQFEREKATMILGPSGCGKTTLLLLLAGLITPTRGQLVEEAPLNKGLILQELGLFPWKTVADNVALPLLYSDLSRDQIKERLDKVFAELGIANLSGRFVDTLSGGQKQRVAIARTLVTRPQVLLLDEVSSSLDAMAKEGLQDLLVKTVMAHRLTLVGVTHDLEEAAILGERLLIMKEGRVVKTLDNPFYGKAHLRESLAFYDFCLGVRRELFS